MKQEELQALIKQALNSTQPVNLFPIISDQLYRSFKDTKKDEGIFMLDFGTKTEFEKKTVADICHKFNLTIWELNEYIYKQTLKEHEKMHDMYQRTKLLLNLFILTRKHKLVIFPIVGLTDETVNNWIEVFKMKYADRKIVGLVIETGRWSGQDDEPFNLKG